MQLSLYIASNKQYLIFISPLPLVILALRASLTLCSYQNAVLTNTEIYVHQFIILMML